MNTLQDVKQNHVSIGAKETKFRLVSMSRAELFKTTLFSGHANNQNYCLSQYNVSEPSQVIPDEGTYEDSETLDIIVSIALYQTRNLVQSRDEVFHARSITDHF